MPDESPILSRARYAEAIDAFAQRTDLVTRAEFARLADENRKRSWTVARVTDLQVMKDLHGAVGQAVEGGQSWREFQDSLGTVMKGRGWEGLEGWHARLVYEQNVILAQSAGRVMQAVDAGVSRWKKLPSVSLAPRPEHAIYDGQIFTFEQMSPPPWDFGCKCEWEAVLEDGDSEIGVRGPGSGIPSPEPRAPISPTATDYFRPLELRVGDYPESLWPLIKNLASNVNALLKLREP